MALNDFTICDWTTQQWNPKATFKEIQGADHFYFGFFKELEAVLLENL